MPLTYWEYQLTILTVSWIGGFVPVWTGWRQEWRWWQALGLALVLSPFVRMGVGVAENLTLLVQTTMSGGFVVHRPYEVAALWRKFWRHALFYLVVPATGLLLVWSRRPRAEDLAAAGLHTREGWRRDALHGLSLFFVILVAYLAAMFLAYVVLRDLLAGTADEAQLWRNVTPLLIVLLSGIAGVSEEFLFRGLLLARLARVMPWGAAAVLQAVAFGLVHSGYLTWAHVLGPAVFGLGMAVVTRVLGIVPAILLHAEINVVFFTLEIVDVRPDAWWLLAGFTLVNLAAAWRTRLVAVPRLVAWFSGKAEGAEEGAAEPEARAPRS